MVQIQNSDAIRVIRDGARLSISQGFPQDLGKTVVPVMDMTPDFHRTAQILRRASSGATGNTTIYTTSATNDFYLTGIQLNYTKDGTADNTSVSVTVFIDGVSTRIVESNSQTTTALSALNVGREFTYPLKLDKNSAIVMAKTFTVGTATFSAIINGFEVMPSA